MHTCSSSPLPPLPSPPQFLHVIHYSVFSLLFFSYNLRPRCPSFLMCNFDLHITIYLISYLLLFSFSQSFLLSNSYIPSLPLPSPSFTHANHLIFSSLLSPWLHPSFLLSPLHSLQCKLELIQTYQLVNLNCLFK